MTDMLFIAQIPEYLYMKYSVRRTRRAISYWITAGLLVRGKRIFLRVEQTKTHLMYTRKPWVDRFIDKMSRRERV